MLGRVPLLTVWREIRLSPLPFGPPAAGRSCSLFSGRISLRLLRNCSTAVSASSSVSGP